MASNNRSKPREPRRRRTEPRGTLTQLIRAHPEMDPNEMAKKLGNPRLSASISVLKARLRKRKEIPRRGTFVRMDPATGNPVQRKDQLAKFLHFHPNATGKEIAAALGIREDYALVLRGRLAKKVR
ncbi:MAG: hypothetical protein J4215_05815 [Candidatus Diapherotrites archaeon]|uniref:Uncharacterized protein n=1 Tax=Candidatus Iainarchaeum sp. TaxID=3101447 RepID=A0A8T4L830_9ARCH|nr:hypothetical protein [Candidatus Diapherotrites archaeon]